MTIEFPEVARVDADGRLYPAQMPEPYLIDLIGEHAPSGGGSGEVGSAGAIVLSVAADLFALSGSPSTSGWIGSSGATRVTTMDFDGAASIEYAGRTVTLPATWAATDVTLIWTTKADGAGDVAWQATWTALADGQSITTSSTQVSAVGTAPAAGVARATVIPAVPITAGVPVMFRVGREPGLTADTLGVDACLISIVLTPSA